MSRHDAAKEKIMEAIDAAFAPTVMPSKAQALDFLESIMTEIEVRIDALRDELAGE